MNPVARQGLRASFALITIIASAAQAADRAAPAGPAKENAMLGLSSSRGPAPRVPPVTIGAVRFLPTSLETQAASRQGPGILGAYDAVTGERLWTLEVYVDAVDPKWESDAQEDHFATLTATPEGKLLIVTETRRRFEVDPQARTARPLP